MQESLQILEKMAQLPEIQLYKELLECLEHEWQALITSQEDAILACAARKEQILSQIASDLPGERTNPKGQEDEVLNRLKRQAAGAQFRNHRLIVAALETIQDFFGYLQSAAPGIYHSAGKVESAPANSYFYRQA
jgi:hypothetical protein